MELFVDDLVECHGDVRVRAMMVLCRFDWVSAWKCGSSIYCDTLSVSQYDSKVRSDVCTIHTTMCVCIFIEQSFFTQQNFEKCKLNATAKLALALALRSTPLMWWKNERRSRCEGFLALLCDRMSQILYACAQKDSECALYKLYGKVSDTFGKQLF